MTYTTLQQAKELIKLGLSESTADMYYEQDTDSPVDSWKVGIGKPNQQQNPCWSAEALLEMLPTTLYDNDGYDSHSLIFQRNDSNSYLVEYALNYGNTVTSIDDSSEEGELLNILVEAIYGYSRTSICKMVLS